VNADKHRKAGNILPFRSFWNNQNARAWEERERQTDITKLKRHIGNYKMREVPERVQMICNGIDVHPDHVWCVVKGYGYRNEQWLIWAGRLETGHTGRTENWDIVERFVRSEWISQVDDNVKYHAVVTGIDARYQRAERDEESTAVYDFCLRFASGYVIPVMGFGRTRMRYVPYRAVNVAGKALKRFDINVDNGKDRLWQLLYDKDREPGPGYMHLPTDVPGEVLRQLSSEEQHVKPLRGGREIVVWEPKKDYSDNHIWDGNVYADFVAELAGVFHLLDPAKQEKEIPRAGKPVGKRPIRTKY
jgi:phage terminase large subunit GpA-like protein